MRGCKHPPCEFCDGLPSRRQNQVESAEASSAQTSGLFATWKRVGIMPKRRPQVNAELVDSSLRLPAGSGWRAVGSEKRREAEPGPNEIGRPSPL